MKMLSTVFTRNMCAPNCKYRMISMFFYIARRTYGKLNMPIPPVRNITIIGGGVTGANLAHVAVYRGFNVVLIERTEKKMNFALQFVFSALLSHKMFLQHQPLVEKQKAEFIEEMMKRYRGSRMLEDGLDEADLILEAVDEDLVLKQKLFGALEGIAKSDTIFTTCTGTLMLSDIAKNVRRLDKFAGFHPIQPFESTHIVELIRLPETTPRTLDILEQFATALGKISVHCTDCPGFIINRLVVPYVCEAIRIVERHEATPRDIDIAMRLGAGYNIGPLTFADRVGLDTILTIMERWEKKYPDQAVFQPPQLLIDLVKEGKLGNKSGEGFFKHSEIN